MLMQLSREKLTLPKWTSFTDVLQCLFFKQYFLSISLKQLHVSVFWNLNFMLILLDLAFHACIGNNLVTPRPASSTSCKISLK